MIATVDIDKEPEILQPDAFCEHDAAKHDYGPGPRWASLR